MTIHTQRLCGTSDFEFGGIWDERDAPPAERKWIAPSPFGHGTEIAVNGGAYWLTEGDKTAYFVELTLDDRTYHLSAKDAFELSGFLGSLASPVYAVRRARGDRFDRRGEPIEEIVQ